MKHNVIRLDDVARTVVHFFPEAMMELFAPVEEPSLSTWCEWRPNGHERMPPWRNRRNVRRLDTQLSPSRWLPDAGYACRTRGVAQLWGLEMQSGARRATPARAGTCMLLLMRQAFPLLPTGDVEIRFLEVRTRRALQPRRQLTRRRRGSRALVVFAATEEWPASLDQSGLMEFTPTDALLKLDPDDRRFVHPWCWPLVCMSRRVSMEHILLRHQRLLDLEAAHAIAFTEIRLLLGLIGRARFPHELRFVTMMEIAMNDAIAQDTLNLGHITEQERSRILIEATARQTRLFNERLEAAENAGRLRGKLEGKLELARKVLARTLSLSALEVAMAHLSGLESAEAIDDALMAMMAGN